MSDSSEALPAAPAPATMRNAGIAAVLSFVLGAVTAYAQGFLPDAAAPLANSASTWTLLTAVLVYASRVPVTSAAALGAVSFVLLVLGYTVASELRGYSYDPVRFGVIGMVVGPVVGVSAAWLHARDLPAALGTAVLAGIGLGEAVYGLTVVDESTSPVSWTIVGVVAAALLVGMLTRRIRDALPVAVAVLGTFAVATAFVLAYRAVGIAV